MLDDGKSSDHSKECFFEPCPLGGIAVWEGVTNQRGLLPSLALELNLFVKTCQDHVRVLGTSVAYMYIYVHAVLLLVH